MLVLVARILFVPIFLASGLGHLRATDMLTGYAASKGIPSPRLAVLVSGVVIVVGGLSVLLGVYPDLGALLLAAYLVPTAFLMHAFWKEPDPMAQVNERTQFLKDLSMAGGAIVLLVLAWAGEFGPSLTGNLF